MVKDKRIYAGYYKRYDGKLIYVISSAKDGDTGEETIIYSPYSLTERNEYYTVSKKSFCEGVTIEGKAQPKYKRQPQLDITDDIVEFYEMAGLRGPIRRNSEDFSTSQYLRNYQNSRTYYDYARDLCKHYKEDFETVRLCLSMKKYIGITKDDFIKVREDVDLIRYSLQTTLSDYKDFFKERFIQRISIRKYAELHDLNRGSVELRQKKLFKELAAILYKRDQTDGKKRLRSEEDNEDLLSSLFVEDDEDVSVYM